MKYRVKIAAALISALLTLSITVKADEGMWLLNLLEQINLNEMQSMGLELTADQIYSLNNASLKDAIGALDYGSCTAELVSAEGLLLTNHHCGYGEIQNHSTIEHNYIKNGFWAMTREEELPNPGKTISFVVRFEDITDKILPLIGNDLGGLALEYKIESLTDELRKKAVEGTHYEAQVKSFFGGNKYYLIVLETFLDVRLVGAPPESIGNFGKDTDNWMWPRHTGDFSIFRVYTGPDGKPAKYSPSNIPLKSKYFLPVSIKGYEKDDFAMVMGFPGTTNRYATSFEVTQLLNEEHPNRIKIRETRQNILMQDMNASEKVRIQYADKYSRSSNYWKFSIGQIQGLNNLDILSRKLRIENEFKEWLSQDPARAATYGEALNLIEEGVKGNVEINRSTQYLFESMYLSMETVSMGLNLRSLLELLSEENPDKSQIESEVSKIREKMESFYKDYNVPTDKKVTAAMLRLMLENVPETYQPSVVREISTKYKGDVNKFVEVYFKKSILPYREKMEAFLSNPSLKTLSKDPGIAASMSFLESYFTLQSAGAGNEAKYETGKKLWISALQLMYPEREFYPDANSSLRFTYGTVGDYKARDAVYYSHFTTLKGVMEKEDPSNPEFIVSEELKDLYNKADYGVYGENGILPVCFTTNNDITGGNSGSPVINGRGELIGLAFDGNWEAMSGDIAFENELQKCINVDIRYVLFVIDKMGNAKHLLQEMMIVN
jgi:hypothetical protein